MISGMLESSWHIVSLLYLCFHAASALWHGGNRARNMKNKNTSSQYIENIKKKEHELKSAKNVLESVSLVSLSSFTSLLFIYLFFHKEKCLQLKFGLTASFQSSLLFLGFSIYFPEYASPWYEGCSNSVHCCSDKIPGKSNLSDERLILAHSSKVLPHHGREEMVPWTWGSCLHGIHIQESERWMLCLFFCLFYSV